MKNNWGRLNYKLKLQAIILPKSIITGKQKLDDKDIDLIKEYLEKSYKQRNETKRY